MNNKGLIYVSSIGAIISCLAVIIIHSLSSAINIPTFHLDGAFQTASGLFRLDAGQRPGRDFFPYLGVGPLILIYVFFKLAGGTLSASVFAAKFVTLALGWTSVAVLWQLIFRPKMGLFSIVGGAMVFMLPFLMGGQFPFAEVFAFAFEPGNSLRPVRGALPFLAAIVSWYLVNNYKSGVWRNTLAGILVGTMLLWSNDYAVPTAMLFAIFYFSLFYVEEKKNWIRNALSLILTVFAMWTLLLSVITGGHPFELLRYNFVDVATDQWWYFGSYAHFNRVFEFSQLSRILSRENCFSLIILFATSFVAVNTRKVESVLISLIGLAVFSGGLLASLGGHLGGYFSAFHYWGAVTAVLGLLKGVLVLISRKMGSSEKGFVIAETRPVIIVFLLLLPAAGFKAADYRQKWAAAESDPRQFYVSEFGGFLGVDWKDYINYARMHKNSRVFEDYWGIWSSLNKRFPSWPVDSVIHALGGVRNVAKQALWDADLIISTRYATSPEWQPWILSQNFWFYEGLFSEWTPDYVSPTTVVWRKLDKARETKDVGCQISSDGTSFVLESEVEGFYSVTLTYSSIGDGRYLAMIKNNISYGADAGGYVSLPQGRSTMTIPVLITNESGSVFESKAIGSDGNYFSIESCVAKKILYMNEEILGLSSDVNFYLTDVNWVRGIARTYAGFFVKNNRNFRSKYEVGRYVYFKDGDLRRITNIEYSGQYINVRIEGVVLDPDDVGLPSEFEVVDASSLKIKGVSKSSELNGSTR